MEPKLLSDKIQEFIDWLEENTDFADWHPSMKITVQKKLIEVMIQEEKQHEWEFYMNGSFCKRCGAQLGSDTPCR